MKYGASTLRDVDVAEAVGITSHQLSELINTRLGIGFSRYVRECRVNAAKALLISAPSRSILSISAGALVSGLDLPTKG